MTGQQIIDLFNLYVDDTSEFSSDEELALLNRIYKEKICAGRPWIFLITEASGTLSASVPYISLPSNFRQLHDNNQLTENTTGTSGDSSRVVFIGTQRRPFRIVNFADRYRYENQDGFAYIDWPNSRLVFTKQQSAESYVFDYIKIPDDIAAGTEPLFPISHDAIAYGMATDSYIIQLFDKARSYAPENNAKYEDGLKNLRLWDANLRND